MLPRGERSCQTSVHLLCGHLGVRREQAQGSWISQCHKHCDKCAGFPGERLQGSGILIPENPAILEQAGQKTFLVLDKKLSLL